MKPKGTLLLSTRLITQSQNFLTLHILTQALPKGTYVILKSAGFTVETFEVRRIISLVYMILFYIFKWVFNKDLNGSAIQKLDDKSYSNQGIATVYLKAVKK
jgi:hypothetical protein